MTKTLVSCAAAVAAVSAFLWNAGGAAQAPTRAERIAKVRAELAFMGYEWTQRFALGGHHKVLFKNDKGRYVTYRMAPFNDSEMEQLVEIHSMHGAFDDCSREAQRCLGF